MEDTDELETKIIVLLVSIVSLSVMCLGAWYHFSIEKAIPHYTNSSQIKHQNKGKKQKRRRHDSIRRSPLAHPTTSDTGSPTLSFFHENPSRSDPQFQDLEGRNIDVKKRVPKRRFAQETLTYNSVRESDCIMACLENYKEAVVKDAVEYLIRKGFPPTPDELLNFEPGAHGKQEQHSVTQKNDRLAKKCRRLSRKEKEYQTKLGQTDIKLSVLKLKCDALQRKNEKLEIDAMRVKCKICQDNEIGAVVRPCDHAFCCVTCVKRLYTKSHGKRLRETCVICNIKVTSHKQFYLS